MIKGLVLSSGGVDSTTCLALAIKQLGKKNVSSVSFYYGQKHKKELDCARLIAKHYQINHYTIDLSNANIYNNSNCALLEKSDEKIHLESYENQINEKEVVNTYVPFRNGLMVSSVAALALSINPEDETFIYLGVHSDDTAGSAYADCSLEFTQALAKAIELGTYNKIKLYSPFVKRTKSEIVKEGLELKVPYELTWSCYQGNEKACGLCATCLDRINAFNLNGINDPISYQD